MNFALDMIFRPLARLCMARGLRFADVAERLRRAYFDEALKAADGVATDSRLSVVTGLQRRDVARLRAEAGPSEPAPDPLARLVSLWLARHGGAPLPLHGEGSFDELAREIRRDVHPKSLRDALEEAGTLAVAQGEARLLRRAHVPLAESDAQLEYLGRNVGDHLSIAVGNVLGDVPGFELAVHANELSAEAVAELESLWRARMRPLLEEINEKATGLQDTSPGTCRMRGGGYFRVGEDR